jgi:hypothetical protein
MQHQLQYLHQESKVHVCEVPMQKMPFLHQLSTK